MTLPRLSIVGDFEGSAVADTRPRRTGCDQEVGLA